MMGGILGWFINKWKTGIGIRLICIVTHMLAKAFSPWDREEIILNSVPQIGRSKDLLRQLQILPVSVPALASGSHFSSVSPTRASSCSFPGVASVSCAALEGLRPFSQSPLTHQRSDFIKVQEPILSDRVTVGALCLFFSILLSILPSGSWMLPQTLETKVPSADHREVRWKGLSS